MKPDVFLRVPENGFSVEWFVKALDVSREQSYELLRLGAVYLEGERVFDFDRVLPGQTLRAFPSPLRFPAVELLTQESVLFENDDFVAVDKPAGLPSVPVASNALENALERTGQLLGIGLYPFHRLDEATRGVLLMAKSAAAVHRFQKLQRAGKVVKTYKALTDRPVPLGLQEHLIWKGDGRMEIGDCIEFTEGDLPEEESKNHSIQFWHLKNLSPNNKIQSVKTTSMASVKKVAILEVLDSETNGQHWLSTIRLITGRTHQIRCQLAHLGCPVVGDDLYGASEPGGLQLLAWRLEFDGVMIESKSPPPQSIPLQNPLHLIH